MKTIRENTFETNSSSCHTLIIVSKEEFEAVKNCDYLINYCKIIPVEQAYKETMEELEQLEEKMSTSYRATYKTELTFDVFKEVLKKFREWSLTYNNRHDAYAGPIEDNETAVTAGLPEDYDTFNTYGGEYYETYSESYTTKSGDEIVAFGYYGHD